MSTLKRQLGSHELRLQHASVDTIIRSGALGELYEHMHMEYSTEYVMYLPTHTLISIYNLCIQFTYTNSQFALSTVRIHTSTSTIVPWLTQSTSERIVYRKSIIDTGMIPGTVLFKVCCSAIDIMTLYAATRCLPRCTLESGVCIIVFAASYLEPGAWSRSVAIFITLCTIQVVMG